MYFYWVPNQKAYKVYDLKTKKIFSSRDVILHEDIFPFTALKDNIDNHLHVWPLSIPDHDAQSIPNISHDDNLPLSNEPQPDTPSHDQTTQPILRRSNQFQQTSTWLHDFQCPQTTLLFSNSASSSMLQSTKGTRYPLFNFVSYNDLSSSPMFCCINL